MSVASAALIFYGGTGSPRFSRGALLRAGRGPVSGREPGSRREEERALRQALAATNGQIAALGSAIGGDAAEILEFQLALLDDESLLDPIFASIARGTPAH